MWAAVHGEDAVSVGRQQLEPACWGSAPQCHVDVRGRPCMWGGACGVDSTSICVTVCRAVCATPYKGCEFDCVFWAH